MAGLSSLINRPILGLIRDHRVEWSLYLFIATICVIDVVTSFQTEYGLGSLSLGQLSKPLVFTFLFIRTIFHKEYRTEMIAIGLFVFYLLWVELSNAYFHQDLGYFIKGLAGVQKTTLPFYSYFYLKILMDKGLVDWRILKNCFLFYTFFVAINVLLPFTLGISFSNYEGGGYSGFYQAGNELNAYLVVSLPMVLYYGITYRDKGALVLVVMVSLVAILTGSKSTLGSVLLSFIYMPFLLHKTRIITIPVITIGGIGVASFIWNYIHVILDLLPLGIYGRLIYTIQSRTNILDILLGVRVFLFDKYTTEFLNADFYQVVFGKGFQYAHSFMFPIMGKNKSAELDIVDFIARYGMLGFTIFTLFLAYTWYKHHKPKSSFNSSFKFAFILLTIAAVLAGHVLSNSFLVFLLSILFALNLCELRGQRPQRKNYAQ